MIFYEDEELEMAFQNGELPVAVMLTVRQNVDGELSIITLRSAEHIAEEYLSRFSSDPFSNEAIEHISSSARDFFEKYSYDYAESAGDILCEFHPRPDIDVPVLTDGAILTVCDGAELEKYENLLDADPGEDICAAVIIDNRLVCAAGINDYSDSDDCEIYVECVVDYRCRGYARAAVLALCEKLQSDGESVIYKTYSSNVASLRLARSCGFIPGAKSMVAVAYSRWEEDTE